MYKKSADGRVTRTRRPARRAAHRPPGGRGAPGPTYAKSESVSRAGDAVFAAPGRAEFAGCTSVRIWKYGPRLAELVFHYGTISNLRAKGVDIGEIYETPKPAWWRQAYEYVGSFFRRAPAPKRKREDDDGGGPAPKKKVAALLRQADENLSAPVEDDDDVVDLTV